MKTATAKQKNNRFACRLTLLVCIIGTYVFEKQKAIILINVVVLAKMNDRIVFIILILS